MTRSVLEVAAALVAADDQVAAAIRDLQQVIKSDKQAFFDSRNSQPPRRRVRVCWAAVRHGRRWRR
jgi:hypothetical protein